MPSLKTPTRCSDDQLQITEAQGFGKGLQVVVLGEPGREIPGFVLPGLPQGHTFELAEGWWAGYGAKATGSGRASTSIWPESKRGRSRSRVRRRFWI